MWKTGGSLTNPSPSDWAEASRFTCSRGYPDSGLGSQLKMCKLCAAHSVRRTGDGRATGRGGFHFLHLKLTETGDSALARTSRRARAQTPLQDCRRAKSSAAARARAVIDSILTYGKIADAEG